MTGPDRNRWRGRPLLSALLRLFVFAAPIAMSILTAALIAPRLASLRIVPKMLLTFCASTLVLVTADRLTRRLLPLAVMLRLSLAFPNEAPSRIALARRAASTRDLERRVEDAHRNGVVDEPTRAAEQILTLVAAVEAHDRATRGHSERVRIYTDLLSAQLRLPLEARDRLRWSALLHDVGKLEVPKKVLNKPGKLSTHEWDLVHRHPDEGARLTKALRTWLGEWAAAIEQHHERYDGAGYPRGLSGSAISLGGRIVAVADSYETMTASRPYRRARSAAKARAELVACSGRHFDPHVVRAFLEISVRRLTFASGPLSWLAQMPLFRGVEQAAQIAGQTAGRAAVGTALAVTLSPGIAHPSAPARPALPATTSSPAPVLDVSPSPSASPSASPKPRFSPGPVISPSESLSPSPRPEPIISASPEPRPSPHPSIPLFSDTTNLRDTKRVN